MLRGNPGVRNLVFALGISSIGDWFNWIATVLVLQRITGGYDALGTLVIIHTGAPVVLAPLAGAAADRFDRRRLLLACDLIRIISVIGLLVAAHVGSAPLVWLFVTVQYVLSAFYTPAADAMMPSLASGDELKTSNAMMMTFYTAAAAGGSMLGGFAVAAGGVEVAFVLDALTFALSAFLVFNISVRPAATADATADAVGARREPAIAPDRGSWADLWRQLVREPRLRASVIAVLGIGLPAGLLWVAVVAVGQGPASVGKDGALSMGILNTATFVGSMIGTLVFNSWFVGKDDREQARGGLRLNLIRCAALFAIAAVPLLVRVTGTYVGLGYACLVLASFSMPSGALWVVATNFAQAHAPDPLRGRIFAMLNALWAGGQAVSVFAATQAMSHGASLEAICVVMAVLVGLLSLAWVHSIAQWPRWAARDSVATPNA